VVTVFGVRADTRPSLVSRTGGWVLPRVRKVSAAAACGWRTFKPVSLSIGGLGCLVAAAFTVSLFVGLLSAGAAMFVAEWRVRG
jgi:hypothetical protein